MATAKLKEKAITVPDEVIEELGLDEGDEFEVAIEGDAIVYRPHEEEEAADAEHLEHIRKIVAKGREDFHAGRVTPAFTNSEEFEEYRKTEEYKKLLESE